MIFHLKTGDEVKKVCLIVLSQNLVFVMPANAIVRKVIGFFGVYALN